MLATGNLYHIWTSCPSKSLALNRKLSLCIKSQNKHAWTFAFHLAFLKHLLLALPHHTIQHSQIRTSSFLSSSLLHFHFLNAFFFFFHTKRKPQPQNFYKASSRFLAWYQVNTSLSPTLVNTEEGIIVRSLLCCFLWSFIMEK